MQEWLSCAAAIGIGVAISVRWELNCFVAGLLCGGLNALFMMFCH